MSPLCAICKNSPTEAQKGGNLISLIEKVDLIEKVPDES
jgi:hypothetical protein